MCYLSPRTVARLLDVSEATVRDWMNNPQYGLGSVHCVKETRLEGIARQDGTPGRAPRRINARLLARFLIRRERTGNYDLTPIPDPTETEISARAQQLLQDAVFYQEVRSVVQKTAKSYTASMASIPLMNRGASGKSSDLETLEPF